MKKHTILEQMKTECSFAEVFQDIEHRDGLCNDVPRKKIGHIRADYDGWRWWNTAWLCHPELALPEITAEIDQVYEELTAKDALADLDTLIDFCDVHPEARVDPNETLEYNFYLEGTHCNFWIRLITHKGDYNIYLNAFVK